MKIKYIIIGIIVLIIIIGGIIFYMKKKEKDKQENVKVSEIKFLYLSYSKGYMINSHIRYEFSYDKENNNYKVMVKPYGVAEEDKLEVEVEESLKDQLKEILIKYDVSKWDGFSKADHNVLDGDDFSFNVHFSNDTSISASGYMMWPNNYRNVVNELDSIFMNIYNKYRGSEE